LELGSRSPNSGVDQTDLLTQEDIRVDEPVCILVLAQSQLELVFEGINGLCDLHQSNPLPATAVPRAKGWLKGHPVPPALG
jgi:hypothetical protein